MNRWVRNLSTLLNEEAEEGIWDRILTRSGMIGDGASPIKKAEWTTQVVRELETRLDSPTRIRILEGCGRRCITQGVLERARAARRASASLDEFLSRLNQAHIGGGHLARDGRAIQARYDRCYCGNVSQARRPFSSTYCNCSRGWYLQLFEQSLGVAVEVQLLQSIIQGAETCQFRITLPGDFVRWTN